MVLVEFCKKLDSGNCVICFEGSHENQSDFGEKDKFLSGKLNYGQLSEKNFCDIIVFIIF